ncbi:MAG: bifunctional 5,10-methylenetetrahydrofolate dehydrogenase/5,10-methenyltetrahydrofolate cyclohydrolase [Ardenticatenia bacterium]|nr:bifunctional 5,10-methylenetetrahydrofolate dehydrogenase/5,10-methenyltetrahydrofolate cyclohydrolase [Ardenticatenia bacterium]
MATLLDGRSLARTLREQLQAKAEAWSNRSGHIPTLALLRAGADEALLSHARSVRRTFERAGFGFQEIEMPAESTTEALVEEVRRLNGEPGVHGILIQEPLPAHVDHNAVVEALNPLKDVDGVHPLNAGRLLQQRGRYHVSSTPLGGITLLERYGITFQGALAVVVGRSNIVGKPLALLLLHRHATVVLCHSRTKGLAELTRQADILCVAVGRAGLITGEMVKPGATVVDFGINVVDGHLVGDVAFDSVAERAGALTPVPGGTGPVTAAMLLRNTLQAAQWLAEQNNTGTAT